MSKLSVIKRDGTEVEYNEDKVLNAVVKASLECKNNVLKTTIIKIVKDVTSKINSTVIEHNTIPTVEEIQDVVEASIMSHDSPELAKLYITYRHDREHERNIVSVNDDNVLLTDSFISKYKHLPFPGTNIGLFTFYRTYSRWLITQGRREYWWEAVRRAVEYNCGIITTDKSEAEELYDNIFNLRQFISSRTMWVGGTEAATRNGMANFNCAFRVVDDVEAFSDMFHILMVGSGAGFRVLKTDVVQLPTFRTDVQLIHEQYNAVPKYRRNDYTDIKHLTGGVMTITVGDSKFGWEQALKVYLDVLTNKAYDNVKMIVLNYDNVRPFGEKLKVFGGTASGHTNLEKMLNKISEEIGVCKVNSECITVKLEPYQCINIANIIAENVISGGVRRSAQIALIDQDDEQSMQLKSDLWKIVGHDKTTGYDIFEKDMSIAHREMSNNSIFYQTKPTRAKLHWHIDTQKTTGEPALVNAEASGRRRDNYNGCNPCFTGDTVVAVSDGRKGITIKQLAEEGRDVLVHCMDSNGKPIVGWMRNPRKTGTDKQLVRVTLSNGHSIKCTPNHQFILSDGTIIQAKDLVSGASLAYGQTIIAPLGSFHGRASNQWSSTQYHGIRTLYGQSLTHREVYKSANGINRIHSGHVHHSDLNSLNNVHTNLTLMDANEHMSLHMTDNNLMRQLFSGMDYEKQDLYREKMSRSVSGENNPRYINVDNDVILNEMIDYIRISQKSIDKTEMSKHLQSVGYPSTGQNEFRDYKNMLTQANIIAGFPLPENRRHSREVNKFNRGWYHERTNLLLTLDNGQVFVDKKCEICGDNMRLSFTAREYGVCPNCTGNYNLSKNKNDRKGLKRTLLMELMFQNRCIPTRIEYHAYVATKTPNPFKISISTEIADIIEEQGLNSIDWNVKSIHALSVRTKLFNDLIAAGMVYNHTVVSVEYMTEKEDVYNGTVDNVHNFGIYVNGNCTEIVYTKQCGEILLDSRGMCNLTEINIHAFVKEDNTLDIDGLNRAQELSARAGFRMTFVELELPKWDRIQKRDRLLGCSITGWQDMVNRVGLTTNDKQSLLSSLREIAIYVGNSYAEEMAVNKPLLTTTVKPSGTISLLPTVSSGIHFSHSPFYLRRIRVGVNDPILKVCEELDYSIKDETGKDETRRVVEFPVQAPKGRTKYDVGAIEQLEEYRLFQEYYTQHNTSITVHVKEDEWDDVEQWIWDNWEHFVGVSFLGIGDDPESSEGGENVYSVLPYESCTQEVYEKVLARTPTFKPSLVNKYETVDNEKELESDCEDGHCPVR